LHRESVAAFEALREVSRTNPVMGSEEWRRWQHLLDHALAVNQQYIDSLMKVSSSDHDGS
jgi:hypothetical protein